MSFVNSNQHSKLHTKFYSKSITNSYKKHVPEDVRMNGSHVYDHSLLRNREFMLKFREYQYQNYKNDDDAEWVSKYYDITRMRMIEAFAASHTMNYEKVPGSKILLDVLKSIHDLSLKVPTKKALDVRRENIQTRYDECVVALGAYEIHDLVNIYLERRKYVPMIVIKRIEAMCEMSIKKLLSGKFFKSCLLGSIFTRTAMVFIDTSSRINYHHSGAEWRRLFDIALLPTRYYDPQLYLIIEDTITNGFEVPYQITTKYRETNKVCFIDRYESWKNQDWTNKGISFMESDRWFDYECMHKVEMRFIDEDSDVINNRNTLNDQSILEIIKSYATEVMGRCNIKKEQLPVVLISDDNMLNNFTETRNRIIKTCRRNEPIITIPSQVDYKAFRLWQIDNIHHLSTRHNLKQLQILRYGELRK